MPQHDQSDLTITPHAKSPSMKIRGVSLHDSELADLTLLARADRRSVSFMVRDAIAAFLESRREELRRLKAVKNNSGEIREGASTCE